MADDFTISRFNRRNISEAFLLLETEFCAYEITNQQVRLTCLLKDLTLAVFELLYDVLGGASTTPYDNLTFAILERMEEPILEFSKWLREEPMNGVANEPLPQKRGNSDSDPPPQTNGDNLSSTLITPEAEFDTEQFILLIESIPENFRLLLMIPTLYCRPSKYQLSTRDEQGERRTLRKLKWQILRKRLNWKQSVSIHNKHYQAAPAPLYRPAIVLPTGSGSPELQTLPAVSRYLTPNKIMSTDMGTILITNMNIKVLNHFFYFNVKLKVVDLTHYLHEQTHYICFEFHIIMKTVFFRRPKKQLILGGFLGIFVIFLFLARYHAPEQIHAPIPSVNNVNPFAVRPQEPRVEVPLAVAKVRDGENNNPFQDNNNNNVVAIVPDQLADFVKEHRGPHQPAAVEKHFRIGADDGGNIPDGLLPENARIAQDALQAIHEAAKEDEKQQQANLAVPDNMNADADPQDNQIEQIKDEPDDGGIPFYLTPRRPPEISTSLSKGPGEGGKALVIHKPDLPPSEREKYEEGEKNNAFNEYASNLISVRRYLPDIREDQCHTFSYTQKHEPASIILCFHNEAWSVLLRSVHSILDRSKQELVKEIILVDDASTMDHLKKPLEVYMNFLQKVKIIRAEERQGLIRARMLGAKAATGKVLVFLDSHIECTFEEDSGIVKFRKDQPHCLILAECEFVVRAPPGHRSFAKEECLKAIHRLLFLFDTSNTEPHFVV
ncbi:hypothetical protein ACTXT7_008313 [Hymenolepis weldensis]